MPYNGINAFAVHAKTNNKAISNENLLLNAGFEASDPREHWKFIGAGGEPDAEGIGGSGVGVGKNNPHRKQRVFYRRK